MTANEIASYTYDAAGRITGITQQLWAQRTVTTASGTTTELYQQPISWQAGYDRRNRLTSFNRAGAQTTYTYDANSNRLTASEMRTSDTDLDALFDQADMAQATGQVLKIEETSNRLLGFTQTITTSKSGQPTSTVTTPVSYAVDANGSMTSDGLRTFDYDASGRLAKVKIYKDGEAASIRYLHNALGQRVFKSEPQAEQTLPKEENLGPGFMNWLRKNFGWMFANGKKASSSLGMACVYGDGELPSWALLAEIDNGTAAGKGTTEYVWLPTEDGSAIPVGMYRRGATYAIHTDHLGTPRLITDSANRPVWQWAYSSFGSNKPSGVIASSTAPTGHAALKATKPSVDVDLRFPGQLRDEETGTFYNYFRDYDAVTGRYRQMDPIGLAGGLSRPGYANQNPLSLVDPEGLSPTKAVVWLVKICKTGIQRIRPVSPEEAVRLARQGKDLESSRSMAKKIANAASEGKKPTKDPVHPDRTTGSTEGRKPHYHPNPRSGSHIFYSAATALTLAGQVDCEDCTLWYIAEGLDFFNPLSLPKDLMDLTGIGAPN